MSPRNAEFIATLLPATNKKDAEQHKHTRREDLRCSPLDDTSAESNARQHKTARRRVLCRHWRTVGANGFTRHTDDLCGEHGT
ncbi:hypothetical protein Acy02nite_90200 [Actinoplanes cyaneus]|uniref:Uncharacterized protein n=1 Tax=Actinoplanes cyaneus TaxID=52696 RepID=A0A919ISX3_9ACTN|nr:hypothetical protein Acy02nite_90200 [Actinoplanes cyaneus]